MPRLVAKRLVSAVLALGVSGLVLWWLLRDGAGQALADALATAHPGYLVLAACLAVFIQVIRAWRFAILADGKASLPSWTMIGIATRLILLNFLLPFKLGELGFPVMMKRSYGTPFAQGAGILILSRLLDFSVVSAILLLTGASLLAPDVIGLGSEMVALLGFLLLLLPILLIGWLPNLRAMAKPWPRLDHVAQQLSFGARMMSPAPFRSLVFGLTCLIWTNHALIAWLTASSIGAAIDFLPLAMASAASNLAFALPISGVAGLGPPQAAWATMLNLAGIAWTPAITTALLCHGLLLCTIVILGAFEYLWSAVRPGTDMTIEKNGS